MTTSRNRVYSAQRDTKEHISAIVERWERWKNSISYNGQGMGATWARNLTQYYSTILDASSWETSLSFGGSQGELVKMQIPQARSMTRQLVTLVTKQRPDFQVISEVTDAKSINEAKISRALTSHISENERVHSKGRDAFEHSCIFGIGYMQISWKTDKGYPYTVNIENQTVQYTGKIEISTPLATDVMRDYTIAHWDEVPEVTIRTVQNRYDLIAQFPELEEKLLRVASTYEAEGNGSHYMGANNESQIEVFEYYHKTSPALPNGRMTIFCNDDLCLFDGDNVYDCLPLEPIMPEPVASTGYGYPLYSALLPGQEMLDHSFSVIATNQSAFGVQSIMAPRGSNVTQQDIHGLSFFHYTPQNAEGGGRPEALQLTESPKETFQFMDVLRANMQEISNISGSLRGQPPPGVDAGVALATLSANAIEFLTTYSEAYNSAMERSMTLAVGFWAKFATIPQMVDVVGLNNQSKATEFKAAHASKIKKIRVRTQNPLFSTIAGRSAMAKDLMSMGLIKDIKGYFHIVDGAPIESLFKNEYSQENLIQSENDALIEGQPVKVLSIDDHALHIAAHSSLLDDPAIRLGDSIAPAVLQHILEHVQQSQTVDPLLYAMVRTGQTPQMGPPPGGEPSKPGSGVNGKAPQEVAPGPATPAEPME